jgi:nucleotide-binding universal stress UspA family protein
MDDTEVDRGALQLTFNKSQRTFRERGMVEIRRILYPSDFSGCSFQVLPYVLSLAQKYNAEIYLLYVARNLQVYAKLRAPHRASASILETTLKEVEVMMDKFCNQHFQVVQTSTEKWL